MSFFVEYSYDMTLIIGREVTNSIADVLTKAIGGTTRLEHINNEHYTFHTSRYNTMIDVFVFDDIGTFQIFIKSGGLIPYLHTMRILYGLDSVFEDVGVMVMRNIIVSGNKGEDLVDLSAVRVSEALGISEEKYLEDWIPEVEDMMEGG